MESNWRFNVWNYGLNGTAAVLAARAPIPLNPNRVVWVAPFGPTLRQLRASTLVGGYANGDIFLNFVPAKGWPYGIVVEPDR